jgi:hypothetical protein
MNRILIIGVEPPCPRCKLLGKIIDEKVREFQIDAEVIHLAYTNTEAKALAQSFGLKPGTAKDVSRKINIEIDSQRISISKYIKSAPPDFDFKIYNDCDWTFELDEVLRPFENRALEVGIMMTPVLIINGELKHQGSLPGLSKINAWISDLIP